MTRVKVFIDYQNVYQRARAAFAGTRPAPHTLGQVRPDVFAELLTDRGRSVDTERSLVEVRSYPGATRGCPVADRSYRVRSPAVRMDP